MGTDEYDDEYFKHAEDYFNKKKKQGNVHFITSSLYWTKHSQENSWNTSAQSIPPPLDLLLLHLLPLRFTPVFRFPPLRFTVFLPPPSWRRSPQVDTLFPLHGGRFPAPQPVFDGLPHELNHPPLLLNLALRVLVII